MVAVCTYIGRNLIRTIVLVSGLARFAGVVGSNLGAYTSARADFDAFVLNLRADTGHSANYLVSAMKNFHNER